MKPVILFDGVCNLCNGAVNFILNWEAGDYFLFASLQSTYGQEFLKANGLPNEMFDTFIVVLPEGGYLTKSDAAFWVCGRLRWPWRWLAVGKYVPKWLRDGLYSLISRYRYHIFGKKDQCRLPTVELKAKFLS